MVSGLQGAIIAAGSGQRLRSASWVPKPLVMLGGDTMLVRQARAILNAGAERVAAIVNSETASIMKREAIAIPDRLDMSVRDTANSMETFLALGGIIRPGHFLMTTVDAVIPQSELERFVTDARAVTNNSRMGGFDGVLGVVKWQGEKRPLFASVSDTGEITALSESEAPMVTAGIYLLPHSVFDFADRARERGLSALRQFLGMLIESGVRLGAIELNGVIDVDEASDLEAARKAVENQR
jgi:NDP-sugar pyrophosphorylase family protein